MYPGYTLRSALDEYAITFFALLDEGYRQKAKDYRMLAQLLMAPEMEPKAWKQLLKSLDAAGHDVGDILKPSGDYSGIEKLRKVLGSDGNASR